MTLWDDRLRLVKVGVSVLPLENVAEPYCKVHALVVMPKRNDKGKPEQVKY